MKEHGFGFYFLPSLVPSRSSSLKHAFSEINRRKPLAPHSDKGDALQTSVGLRSTGSVQTLHTITLRSDPNKQPINMYQILHKSETRNTTDIYKAYNVIQLCMLNSAQQSPQIHLLGGCNLKKYICYIYHLSDCLGLQTR